MKKWIILLIGIVCLGAAIADTLTYGPDNYLRNRQSALSGSTTRDPFWLFINEVDDTFGGTESIDLLLFNSAGADPSALATGQFWFDTAANTMKFTNNAGSATSLAAAAGNSLDQSYDAGIAITVDAGAVALTATDAANNVALAIAQSDTGTTKAVTITNAGTGNGLDFQAAQAGLDAEGTDDTWNISTIGTFNGEIVTGKTNGQAIVFDTNAEIQFGDAGEDVAMVFTANTVTWATDTSVAQMAFGVVDNLTGIADITFDNTATSAISKTSTGGAEDLTIEQAGDVDSSIFILSSGTGADAIVLNSTAGGVDILSGGASLDIDIDASAASVNIDSGEAAADDAIVIVTTGAGSGIQITSLADIDITTTGAATEDITIDNNGGSINIVADEAQANSIVIDAENAGGGMDIDAGTASIDIDCTGGDITLDNDGAGKDITLTSDAGRVQLKGEEAADNAITLVSAAGGIDMDSALSTVITSSEATGDAIVINTSDAAGGIDITSGTGDLALVSTDDITLTVATAATDAIVFTNTAGTNITEDSMAIEVRATAGGINIQSDASLDGDTVVLRVDGGATADILLHNDAGTGLDSIEVVSDEGGILVDAGADDAITLTAGTGGVVFTNGQTRKVIYMPGDVVLDPSEPPGTTNIGTTEQAYFETLNFDANPNATGDDVVFVNWVVPPGYITDSASLSIYWTHSNAEDAADEIDIDGTVNAIAPGEAIDAAGTAMVAVTSVIADASANAGLLVKTSLDIEVETIEVGDLVCILFFVDESASLMAASGTADVHYFEIEYESSE